MSAPLVDPALAAWQAADPAAYLSQPDFLTQGQLAPELPLHSRSHIERDLAVAVVVIAGLVVRELHKRQPNDLNDATEIVHGAWKRSLPMWLRLAAPAIAQAYILGKVEAAPDALLALSQEYAEDLGSYIGETSGEAMLEGLNRQLNQRWSLDVAWHRASAGYGLDKQQMQVYLASAAATGETSPELVPQAARTLVDRLLLRRATRIGQDQAYTAEQTGRALLWMKAYSEGQIPDAQRQWVLGAGEEHCALCSSVAGQKVAPDQPFELPGGTRLWAPRIHPGCNCHVQLVGAEGDVIAKRGLIAAGLCLRARDTGRVLMLQRALDPKDPAGGTWEFPGGHIEPGEEPLAAAKREWSEEVRRRVPLDARYVSQWLSPDGKYQGAILEVPDESAVPPHRRGRVTNPDDPDGDEIEAIAWWDPAHVPGSRGIRPELLAAWSEVRDALRVTLSKAYGNDPATRDAHGRWSSVEGRRSVATLERPDPTLLSLVRTVQQPRQPLTSTGKQPLTRSTTSLTGGRSLTQQRALTAGPLQALTQQVATERRQAVRTAAPVRIHLSITMPRLEPRPGRDPHPFVLPYNDLRSIEYEYSEGQVDHDTLFRPGATVNFSTYLESMHDRADLDDLGGFDAEDDYFGRDEDFGEGREAARPAPSFVARREGWRHHNMSFDQGHAEFFGDVDHGTIAKVRQAALDNAMPIIMGLDRGEVEHILTVAGYEPEESTGSGQARIVHAVEGHSDPSLADAYADFIAFGKPGDAGTPEGDQLYDEMEHYAVGMGQLPVAQVFVFDEGLHSGDRVEGDAAHIMNDYEVTGVEYKSAHAKEFEGEDPPTELAGYRLVYVKPKE